MTPPLPMTVFGAALGAVVTLLLFRLRDQRRAMMAAYLEQRKATGSRRPAREAAE